MYCWGFTQRILAGGGNILTAYYCITRYTGCGLLVCVATI